MGQEVDADVSQSKSSVDSAHLFGRACIFSRTSAPRPRGYFWCTKIPSQTLDYWCTLIAMKIVWDEPKRRANLLKHGFDFAALTEGFFAAATIVPAKAGRFMAVGDLDGVAMVVVVVFAPLGSEAVSVISMRRATAKERNMAHG